jgi:hypothetical protein
MLYHGSHCRGGGIISPNLENRQSTNNSTADSNRSRVNLVRCGESGRSIVTNKRSGGPPWKKEASTSASRGRDGQQIAGGFSLGNPIIWPVMLRASSAKLGVARLCVTTAKIKAGHPGLARQPQHSFPCEKTWDGPVRHLQQLVS